MSLPPPPHIRVPIAGQGACADPWYTWFQRVQRVTSTAVDVDSLIADIATALGSPDGSIAGIPAPSEQSGSVIGLKSLQSFGALAEGQVSMSLRNDVNVPGNAEYYGSSPAGARGWHAVSDAMAQGAGLALTVGANGVTTFALADLPNSGSGTLQKTARDQYGRLAGTSLATTDDLTEGTNLYHTAQRVRDIVLAGLSTAANAAIAATDTVLGALGKLQAQITAHASAADPHTQYVRLAALAPLPDAADDPAAATAGVVVGAMYRTGSILKVRIS